MYSHGGCSEGWGPCHKKCLEQLGYSSFLCLFPSIVVDLVVVRFCGVVPEQVSLACSTGRGVRSVILFVVRNCWYTSYSACGVIGSVLMYVSVCAMMLSFLDFVSSSVMVSASMTLSGQKISVQIFR